MEMMRSTKRITTDHILPSRKTALVIIDMMNLFCDPEFLANGNSQREKWFALELENVVRCIQGVLERFRDAQAMVVHVVNAKWTKEAREAVPYQRDRDYSLFDTFKMSVIEPLKPTPGEIIIRKVTSSAFTGTGFDFLLNNARIENVVLCGQYGDACVFYTLIQSREFGFTNYYVEDAILFSDQASKDLFISLVGSRWATLATAKEIERAISM